MSLENPRIAVVGAGAIGGYYGCMLARAGLEVHFLARSDYEHVKENGYEIRKKDEILKVIPAGVHKETTTIGKVDLVIVATKATSNEALPDLLKPLTEPGTLVLSLQNGMGNAEFLAKYIPAVQILGGLCFVCINRVAPGVIENYLPGQVFIGEFMGSYRSRTQQLVDHFEKAGIECFFSRSLEESYWRKLCWNIPFNGLTIAAGGVPTDVIMASPELTELARQLMEEVRSAAKAYGHTISDDFLNEQIRVTKGMGPYRPSSLLDFLAGREVEVEAIFGEPLRRGQQKRLKLPAMRTLYLLLCGLCNQRKNG